MINRLAGRKETRCVAISAYTPRNSWFALVAPIRRQAACRRTFKKASHAESIHFLFRMRSAVCDVTEGGEAPPSLETTRAMRCNRTETCSWDAECVKLFLLQNNTTIFSFFQPLKVRQVNQMTLKSSHVKKKKNS